MNRSVAWAWAAAVGMSILALGFAVQVIAGIWTPRLARHEWQHMFSLLASLALAGRFIASLISVRRKRARESGWPPPPG